jgi:hypothetical protein
MLGFLKRRRQERAMAKVGEAYANSLGDDTAAVINKWFSGLAKVDADYLDKLDQSFRAVQPSETFDAQTTATTVFEIIVEKRRQGRETIREAEHDFFKNVREIADTLGATAEFEEIIQRRYGMAELDFRTKAGLLMTEAFKRWK